MSLVAVKNKHDMSIAEKAGINKSATSKFIWVNAIVLQLMSLKSSHKIRKNNKDPKSNNQSEQHF